MTSLLTTTWRIAYRTVLNRTFTNSTRTFNDSKQESTSKNGISNLLNSARTYEPELSDETDSMFPSDIEEREKSYRAFKQDQARHSLRPNIDPTLTSIVLFPGQGSQFVGMGQKLLHYPNVKEMYTRASALLGYDLLDLCLHGPKEKLDSTLYCQPSLFVTSLAATEKLKEDHAMAVSNCVATAGFSVGELAALVFSGALSFEQGLRVVQARAKAMQEASEAERSGMMSVFIRPDSRLGLACKTAEEYCKVKLQMDRPICRIANYISPDCKVIAGHQPALNFIRENLAEFNLKRVKILPVSGAFHTSLMSSAVQPLHNALQHCKFNKPLVSVHCNYTGKRYMGAESIANILCKQVVSPVKWEQTLHILYTRDPKEKFPRTFEVGPGKQLGTLLRTVNAKAYAEYRNVEV